MTWLFALACNRAPDPGLVLPEPADDTGSPADTADTGDSADTGDTADTGDMGPAGSFSFDGAPYPVPAGTITCTAQGKGVAVHAGGRRKGKGDLATLTLSFDADPADGTYEVGASKAGVEVLLFDLRDGTAWQGAGGTVSVSEKTGFTWKSVDLSSAGATANTLTDGVLACP